MSTYQILLADPLAIVRGYLRTVLQFHHYQVTEVSNHDELTQAVAATRPDIAIINPSIILAANAGERTALATLLASTPTLLLVADAEYALDGELAHVIGAIGMPFDGQTVRVAVARALAQSMVIQYQTQTDRLQSRIAQQSQRSADGHHIQTGETFIVVHQRLAVPAR